MGPCEVGAQEDTGALELLVLGAHRALSLQVQCPRELSAVVSPHFLPGHMTWVVPGKASLHRVRREDTCPGDSPCCSIVPELLPSLVLWPQLNT